MPTPKLFFSLALAAGALWAQSVSQEVAAPKRAQLVTLNLIAVDNHNQPVGDLTSDDFQIQDQGKRQQIVYFRHYATKPAASDPGSHQYSNRTSAAPEHATVILVDLLNADLSDRGSSYDGIDRTLQHLESANGIYLYLLTAEAKLYPIHGLPGSESDAQPAAGSGPWTQQIHTLLDGALRKVNRLKPVDAYDPTLRVNGTYQALGLLASRMAAIPGRKNIVWITHGVPIIFASLTNDLIDTTQQMRRFCFALDQFGVAMYSVDQGGPGSQAPDGGRSHEGPGYQSQDTLQQMADLTGGRIFPANNVESAISASIESARGSYLVLYDPPPQNWDGKFHKISVKCTRKGTRIQAQQGYVAAPREAIDNQIRAAFEAAATSSFDAAGIGVRASVAPGPQPHTLRYQLHIDPADVVLLHQGDRDFGQLAIGFVGFKGNQSTPTTPVLMNVSLTQEQLATAKKEGIPFEQDQPIPEGVDKVRIVVLDLNSAETGALTIPVAHAE